MHMLCVSGMLGMVLCLIFSAKKMYHQNTLYHLKRFSKSFCIHFVISTLAFLSFSQLGPGRKYSILLLLTIGMNALMLFKFELLPLFVQHFELLFVSVQLLSGPVFAQHCFLPALQVIGMFVLQFTSLSSFSVPIVLQLIYS